MLRHKNIDRVCCVILALTLLLSAVFVGAAATGLVTEDAAIGYETRLFDQSRVHTIDIVMNDWEGFVSTATSEEYSSCHLVIDGESYKNVAIRGKGNTSLSSVQAYGNNRYSFKVEFDHYQTGATYHGLDKLSLNNLIQDNTYMKDYFAYILMNKMGVAAPLCSFVQVNVNGEPWGLYLAVEGVEDAFLQRNYGKDHGELYKPDSMSFGGGRGNGRDFDMDEMAERFGFSFGGDDAETQTFTMPETGEMPAASDGFESSGESSADNADSSGSQSSSAATATPEPTPTATPEPTAAPTPTDNASSGESSGDSAGGSSGDAAGSSGLPAMPTDGTMPDMGSMPQMPGGEAPAMPADGMMPDMSTVPGNFDPSQMSGDFQMPEMNFGGGGFGGFGSSTDVKLQYSDDDPDSYANIFNNAKTDITAADQTRLIASLKALGEGDVSVVDTDAVIRYMAVHNFLCNDDSYTGTIIHNYYLYEEDGVMAMIPWDYNLAYGGHSMGFGGDSDAASVVNRDIDTLVSNGSGGDRPMADWITASEEAMAQYHAIYEEFMTTVFDSGWFESEIDRVITMISPYVESDPTAFCTYEEFVKGAETLKQFCLKRAQSVRNQLDGSDTAVDVTGINLSDMGTMGNMGGRGGEGFAERFRGFAGYGEVSADSMLPPDGRGETAPDPGEGAFNFSSFDFGSSGGSSASEAVPSATPAAEDTPPGDAPLGEAAAAVSARPVQPAFDDGFNMRGIAGEAGSSSTVAWLIVCVLVLGAALILVKVYPTNR